MKPDKPCRRTDIHTGHIWQWMGRQTWCPGVRESAEENVRMAAVRDVVADGDSLPNPTAVFVLGFLDRRETIQEADEMHLRNQIDRLNHQIASLESQLAEFKRGAQGVSVVF